MGVQIFPGKNNAPSGRVSVEDVEKVLDQSIKRARAADAHTDKWLRRGLGYGSLLAIGVQLYIADRVFFKYGDARHWKIPTDAMDVWLAAVVVQLFIILQGIGNYLFPPEERRRRSVRDWVFGKSDAGPTA